jgi:hypothetical protein
MIRSWRFYDHIRTDADAPARRSKIGTRTFVLDHDGSDLAAALRTIAEAGDASALDAAIDSAFPGSRLRALTPASCQPSCTSTACCVRSGSRKSPMARCAPALGRRAAQPAPGQSARAERARDQPAQRPAAGSGRPDRPRRHPDAGDRRHALTDPGRRAAPVSAERPDRAGHHRAGQGIRRNCRRWPRPTGRAALALAKALGIHLPPKRRRSRPGTLSDPHPDSLSYANRSFCMSRHMMPVIIGGAPNGSICAAACWSGARVPLALLARGILRGPARCWRP